MTRILFGLALCVALAPWRVAAAGPDAVAFVDGRPIRAAIFEMYLTNARVELDLDPSTPEGRRRLELARAGILAALVDRALVTLEAERRNLHISPQQLAEAERRTIARFGGAERYDAYLAEHRLTRADYLDVVRDELYAEALRADLTRSLAIPDAEIRAYYEKHRDDPKFRRPALVTASHILVDARAARVAGDRAEIERLRQRAETARRRAVAGESFAALARELSHDPATRERGGDLGSFARGTHTRAFDDAAFATKPGAISPVVETEYGFHVVAVSAHEPARTLTLAEAAPEIRRRLFAPLEAKTLNTWLENARRTAAVRIVDRAPGDDARNPTETRGGKK